MIYALSAPEEIWPLRFSRVIFQEITITGTYSAGPYETRRALSLLKQGWIDASQLITHRFPLEQADQAWLLTKQKGDSLKVMVAV
jgi:L-iditol 2-dehydrogenase